MPASAHFGSQGTGWAAAVVRMEAPRPHKTRVIELKSRYDAAAVYAAALHDAAAAGAAAVMIMEAPKPHKTRVIGLNSRYVGTAVCAAAAPDAAAAGAAAAIRMESAQAA